MTTRKHVLAMGGAVRVTRRGAPVADRGSTARRVNAGAALDAVAEPDIDASR